MECSSQTPKAALLKSNAATANGKEEIVNGPLETSQKHVKYEMHMNMKNFKIFTHILFSTSSYPIKKLLSNFQNKISKWLQKNEIFHQLHINNPDKY